jgi:unsaturated rhamnogalacturonyl hydrolase
MQDGRRGALLRIFPLLLAAAASSASPAAGGAGFPRPDSVLAQMRKVADWQNANLSESAWDPDWTQAPFFSGLLALNRASGEGTYLDIARKWSIKARWKVRDKAGKNWRNPDNRACTQVYLEIFLLDPRPANDSMIADVRSRMDEIIRTAKSGPEEWFALDHVYMAAPVQPLLYQATHEQKQLDHLDALYWSWHDNLFDKEDSLYYHDRGQFPDRRKTANGKKIFWGRGVGWAVGALVRVLEHMPESHPLRPRYVKVFQGMMNTLRELQDPSDGLWRSSLMDPAQFPQPETSGSGFFTLGLAWGINHGLLDREIFLPAAIKAWNGMVWAVQPGGQLGWIQPPDVEPGTVPKTTTAKVYYGPGAFLLAGEEVAKLGVASGVIGGGRLAPRPDRGMRVRALGPGPWFFFDQGLRPGVFDARGRRRGVGP